MGGVRRSLPELMTGNVGRLPNVTVLEARDKRDAPFAFDGAE